jgi:hypothetical protein
MPVLVCDQPPSSVDAIVARVQDQALPFGPGWTIRTSPGGIRTETRQRLTNRSPDLSIARARLQGLVSQSTADLDRYSRFAAGWDGYAGDPIAPVAITAAEQLTLAVTAMNGAQRLTDIIPGPAPDGSLDIELRTEKRRLIVTIYPGSAPNDIEIRTFRTDSVTSEEKNDLGADALVADIRWLLA